MEDLFVEELPKALSFGNKDIMQAIIDIEQCIQSERRNDFKFLCAVRSLIKESSHGGLILNGDISVLKYSWLNDKIQLLVFLQKQFGFTDKYLETITRVIVKFICVNTQNAGVPWYKFDFCEDLGISKLQELLSLSETQIQLAFSSGDLTVKSTKKEIRDYVKSLKGRKENKVLETPDQSEVPIDKCQQYVVFSLEDFEFIKNIVLDKKNKLNDTSAVISAMIKYFKDNNIKLN